MTVDNGKAVKPSLPLCDWSVHDGMDVGHPEHSAGDSRASLCLEPCNLSG